MKSRLILVVALVLGVAFVGCKKDEAPAGPKAEQVKPAEKAAPEAKAAPAAKTETPAAKTEEGTKTVTETKTVAETKPATQVAPAAGAADPLAAPADVAAPPAGAQTTESGLASIVLKEGQGGDKPGSKDTVKVHYTGWTTDGKMFDSSVKRGQPATFPLNRVIAGWTEGLQLMTVGEKRRFWIPGKLAYGDTPQRPGAPAGTLVFDVELLGIDKAKTVEAPADVAAAPADAKKTDSGLAYKSLQAGTGDRHPAATDTVRVHYSGWTTDGEMFDSSVVRGQPATFPLNRVIPGWTEGLQLMKVGEKMRFWIPGNLAYGDKPQRPGAPAGTLVFDVELLGIQ